MIMKVSKKIQVSHYCRNINNKYKLCKLNWRIKTDCSLSYRKNWKKWKKTQKMMNKY